MQPNTTYLHCVEPVSPLWFMDSAAALGMCSVNIHDFDTHWPRLTHKRTQIDAENTPETNFLNTTITSLNFFFLIWACLSTHLLWKHILHASHPNVCLVLYHQKHYLFLRPNGPHEDSTECTLTVISPVIFAQWTQIKAKWPLSDGKHLTVSTTHSSSLKCLCLHCTRAITTIHSLNLTK